jgi:hypothetical protein
MVAKYKYEGPNPQVRETVIDDETALWCMRMCWGEGGKDCSRDKASAMLWAIMHRWNLWPGRKKFQSYQHLMRAFSQPINPKWQKGGVLAEKFKNKEAGSPARLRRRASICSLTEEKIKSKAPQIYKAVKDFQDGALFMPDVFANAIKSRASNWASLPSTPKKNPQGFDIDGDWFFEDKNLIPGFIIVEIED